MNLFNSWLVEQPIAHRGLHDKAAPENSLAAFANAIDNGYAIEFDVRSIADGTVIVFHDESLSRLTDNDGYVKFLNKADLSLLSLKGSEEKIPTLQEALDFIDGRVPILIEIKNDGKVGDLEKSVLEILKNYTGDYAIQSFNPYVLEYFKKNAPHILRGQLAGFFKGQKLAFFKKYALKRMLLNSKISYPDFISYEAARLPNRFVRKYKKLPLLAWTVKSQSEYMKVVKYCDNIIFEGFEPNI
ncbi:MAG: glycerophosphodiester phosphodiesterase [Clostridia bacterium]|nr:glycerophosphodiester phosphodiesterase [Clostridia bacterium]